MGYGRARGVDKGDKEDQVCYEERVEKRDSVKERRKVGEGTPNYVLGKEATESLYLNFEFSFSYSPFSG